MSGMKDSGIEWIGEIPQSWKVEKIKYVSVLNGRIGWQGLTTEEYLEAGPFLITGTDFVYGKINWDSCVHISEERWEEANKIQINNGDLLITKDGTIGKVAIVCGLTQKASLNSGVMRIGHDEETVNRYLYYVLTSDVFWNWFSFRNSGNSTILHLYQKDFEGFIFPYPSKLEQNYIAKLLDDKCSQIDSIIYRIEKQIELLKEYKISLITEAVTKGLDKNIPMKDSGIEWIGDIPESWEVKRLKDIACINQKSLSEETPSEYTFDYVDISSVSFDKGIFGSEPLKFTESPSRARRVVRNGDSIISTVRTYLKAIAYVQECDVDTIVSTGFAVLTPKEKTLSKFLYYGIISKVFLDTIDKYSYGIAYPAINTEILSKIKLCIPDGCLTQMIIDFLDDKCSQIDKILNKKERQLELIKEHKQSLIFEHVTGKKRVEGYHGN